MQSWIYTLHSKFSKLSLVRCMSYTDYNNAAFAWLWNTIWFVCVCVSVYFLYLADIGSTSILTLLTQTVDWMFYSQHSYERPCLPRAFFHPPQLSADQPHGITLHSADWWQNETAHLLSPLFSYSCSYTVEVDHFPQHTPSLVLLGLSTSVKDSK